ncbi:MAG TPA: TetR/AcrR family transcriptional regulator [Marinospirillum sp.]|uniref:TetR/AcrR family transcriptional regulator n=1 Tax=Marinospirillum sp. TaxID=2183934 RepID=UPI002B497AA1|nr:TetR/AcrR family transcriptional regulator [Marinospirillum sp.]HKM16583.1 TetR/AcrR family transcriptional regulator [Marinospirillum sp.]
MTMTTTPLTRNDWITAATDILTTSGIDLVRVDSLAKQLKITRGSFYYHFKSRQDLLQAILDSWRLKATENVINGIKNKVDTPKKQLSELMTLPLKGKKSYEAASIEASLRVWARRDKMARAAVDEVDSYRLNFIKELFIKMEHSTQQAEDLAMLVYSNLVATSLINTGDSKMRNLERSIRLAEFLSDNCPTLDCKFRHL